MAPPGIPTHVQTLGAVEGLQTDVVLRDQMNRPGFLGGSDS